MKIEKFMNVKNFQIRPSRVDLMKLSRPPQTQDSRPRYATPVLICY